MGAAAPVVKLGSVVGLLVVSTLTVPTSVLWVLYFLATHLAVQALIAAEAASVFGRVTIVEEAPSADAVSAAVKAAATTWGPRGRRPDGVAAPKRLPFTEAVVKEVLWLSLPFPLNARVATADTSLGVMAIPAGTPVYVLLWLLHRFGAHFPHSFDPDRRVFAAGAHVAGGTPIEWVFTPIWMGASRVRWRRSGFDVAQGSRSGRRRRLAV